MLGGVDTMQEVQYCVMSCNTVLGGDCRYPAKKCKTVSGGTVPWLEVPVQYQEVQCQARRCVIVLGSASMVLQFKRYHLLPEVRIW
jgi:hypothetical protein